IDGTLLTPAGKLSERTKYVIHRVLNKYPNLHFVLASGRARPATLHIREKLNIINRPYTESLLSNGCVVYDSNNNVVYQDTIPSDFFIKAHKIIKPSQKYTYLYSTIDDAITYSERWAKIMKEKYKEQVLIADKNEFVQKVETGKVQVNKFSFLVSEAKEADDIKEKLEDLRKEYKLKCIFSNGPYLGYMPPNTNKGTSLSNLIQHLNIKKEEVIAFGDGINDIELFQNSGWPIAMENASDKLKPYAKLITKSNAEDGVADMLEKIFLKDE
ncbi:hypothetical protein BCR36DRAFT_297899, partial [Piromyces finnis]